MTIDAETLFKAWPMIFALICCVIWNIRLESKVLYLEKDYEKHQNSIAEKDKALWIKFDSLQATVTTVLQMLTRLETKIEMKRKDQE